MQMKGSVLIPLPAMIYPMRLFHGHTDDLIHVYSFISFPFTSLVIV